MRMAFEKLKLLPSKALKFIVNGYSAYPLAAQKYNLETGSNLEITQVIGLNNVDAISTKYRWVKQIVELLNRTFKSSYRNTNGYNSSDDALYGVSLWVAYYNFLRPHPYNYWRPLNTVDALDNAELMPTKWQILIKLGQLKILELQEKQVG
jgi:hypothetical protein